MSGARTLILGASCVAALHAGVAVAQEPTCSTDPWAARQLTAEEGAALRAGPGGECLSEVSTMTGEATLFDARPGWSEGRVALAEHATGYYLRLAYGVPTEWDWYGANTINPLVLGLEDGTELTLYPVCEMQASSGAFTGYFRASPDQQARLAQQRVTYARQFMSKPANVESEYLKQNDRDLSYFELRSAEEPPTANVQTLARCISPSSEEGVVVVPAATAVEEAPPAESGIYSKRVRGKLWLEAFAGPSAFDPDRFGLRYDSSFGSGSIEDNIDVFRARGPDFGGTIGGAFAKQIVFIGATYRQANYKEPMDGRYKLLKAGVDVQITFTMASYVHPLIRVGGGYARAFGGDFSSLGFSTNGAYATLGVGLRIPVIRWISVFGTFDWSYTTVSPSGFEADFNLNIFIDGSQLSGTFGVTFHFVDVRS